MSNYWGLRGKHRRAKTSSRRQIRLWFEALEDRWMLSGPSCSFDSDSSTVSCVGSGDLYLYVDGGGGILRYGDTSSLDLSVSFTGTPTVTYDERDSTVYVTGMQGATSGTSITFDITGPVQVVGDVNTQGGDLEIDGASIIVGNAVLGDSGMLTASDGATTFTIASSDENSRTMSVTPSAGGTLADGQTLTFGGTSGSTAYTLQDGASYAVQVISQDDDSSSYQIQLFQQPAQSIVVSTSPPTSASSAAGSLTLKATHGDIAKGKGTYLDTPTITLGPGSQLQATGSGGDGSISMTADDTFTWYFGSTLLNQIYDLFNHSFQATIEIAPSVSIAGGDVTLNAQSGAVNVLGSTPSTADALWEGIVNNFLVNVLLNNMALSLPVSVLITQARATTEVGPGATISSSGSVNLSSSATANSTGEATNFWTTIVNRKVGGDSLAMNLLQSFSFALAKATTNAQTLVDDGVQIIAADNIAIGSTTKTTVSATSLESRNQPLASADPLAAANPNALGLSAAYNKLKTTSHAIVSQGTMIHATQGNVTVAAAATDTSTIKVQSNVYRNGVVGLSGAGAEVDADVLAKVDGTVIAGGASPASAVTFNPFWTPDATGAPSGASPVIDYANSRFVFTSSPGYASGEPLVYRSGGGLAGSIPGLVDDTTYFAIPSNNGSQFFVRLAATPADASNGTFLPFGQYPTINGIPITNIDASSNSSLLFDFDPGFTEGQTVAIVPAAGQFLGYVNADGSLAGPLAGTYVVHIVNGDVDNSGLHAVQLRLADGTTAQLDARPYLTTNSGQVIRIQSFNTDGELLTLNPTDVPSGFSLQNGDMLTYHAALATTVTGLNDGTTYYAIVDPSQFVNVATDSLLTLQLAATVHDAASANPATSHPTFRWTDSNGDQRTTTIEAALPALGEVLIGEEHSLSIVGSDSATHVVTVELADGAPHAPGTPILSVGDLFKYVGATGTSGTLQSGRLYVIDAIVDQSDPNAIQLTLQDAVRVPTLGMLTESAGAGQVFTIQSIDAGSDQLLTLSLGGSGTFTPLTEGETLIYSGASIDGFLMNGQSYRAHVVEQTSASLIQIQLTPFYYVAPSGVLHDQAGQSFLVTNSDPASAVVTLSGPTNATLSLGHILTYDGPSIDSSGYLQSGRQYRVASVNSASAGTFAVELVDAEFQVATAGVLQGSGQAPSNVNDHFNPLAQSFQILGGDFNTGIITVSLQAQSEFTTLAEGEILRFQGVSGVGANMLQDGQLYVVHVIDQSDSNAIQIQLRTVPQQVAYGTLAGSGGSYVIHKSDADGTVWLSQVDSSEALVDGDSVTFHGTSGGLGYLQNGETYVVSVVNQSDPLNMQIRLARHIAPTYGTLASAGGTFTIQSFNSTTQVVTIAAPDGTVVSPLANGQTLVYAGADLSFTPLLRTGRSYSVRVLDQSDPSAIEVLLLDSTGPIVSSVSADGSDPGGSALIVDPSQTPIPDGTILTYHAGGPGTKIGGLQDGAQYQAVVDPASPTTVHLRQTPASGGQAVALTLQQELEGGGRTYQIVGSNSAWHTITILESGAAAGTTSVAEGDSLVYHGAFGQSTGSLVDGQTYFVHLPNPGDSTMIQLLASPADTTPLNIQSAVRLGQLQQSYLSGTSHSLTPVNQAGISITATLGSTDKASVAAGIGSEPIGKQVSELKASGALKLSGAGSSRQRAAEPEAKQFSGPISLTGSFLFLDVRNSAVAEVGRHAVLKSARDITVSGMLTERHQSSDSATNSQKKPQDGTGASTRKVDLAAAVVVNLFQNTAQSLIDGGAQVDAAGALSVSSNVSYPWAYQVANPEKFNVGLVFQGLFTGGLLKSELVNNWAMAASTSANEGQLTLAGSVSYLSYDNTSEATIGDGARINQDPAHRNVEQSVSVDATTTFQSINYTGNTWFNFGPINAAANRVNDGGWKGVGNTIFGGQDNQSAVGVGASLTFIDLNNTTQATVGGPNTRINFGNAPANLSQTFDGDSDVDLDTWTIRLPSNPGFTTGMALVYDDEGGTAITGLTSGDTYYAIVSPSNPNQLQLAKTLADAEANLPAKFKKVGGGAQTLTAQLPSGFNVTASQNVLNVNLGTSGGIGSSGLGAGGKHGGNGTFAAFTAHTTTAAQVSGGTIVNSNPATAGAVNVAAGDNLVQASVVGGAFKAQSLGVGLSGILNDVTRTTQALIGDDPRDLENGALPGSSNWNVAGPVNVTASTSGDVVNLALAAAVNAAPAAKQQDGGQQANAAPVQQSSWGLQISGDGSYSKITDKTAAYINDTGGLTTGPMTIDAKDSTTLVGFGGAFAVAYLSPGSDPNAQGNSGVAGSYAEINLAGSTEAYVRNANLVVSGDLSVTAERENYLGALTASTATSSSSSTSYKSSWELAGSVALSFFSGDTIAYLSDVNGHVNGDLTVTATDRTIYVAIGGAVGVAASAGIGVSFGYTSVSHDIQAYATSTQLTVAGIVNVAATAQSDIGSLGVALGIANGASWGAGAGNASVNNIRLSIDAHIGGGSTVTSEKAVTIAAVDRSYLVAVAGSVAASEKGAIAVGAAVGYDLINNAIEAYIDDATVIAQGGDLSVTATSTPTLIAVAAGGSGAANVAIGGSVTINSVTNSVDAHVTNSTVWTSSDLLVTATESALLVAVAGAIALTVGQNGNGSDAAVGAAVAYNYIGQTFDASSPVFPNGSPSTESSCEAFINASHVTVGGDLKVSAGVGPPDPLPDVTKVTVDGSTGFGYELDLSGAIDVNARLVAVAVGGAGGATFSMGGAVTMAYVRQTIQAYVGSSQSVNVAGNATITAIDDSSIGTGAGGVALAKSSTAGVGAGVAYNDLANNLLAAIGDSNVVAGGGISVVSLEQGESTAVAAGGSLADSFALGGAVVVNVIDNNSEAHVNSGSTVRGTSVLVSSDDLSTIKVGAGQVGIATNGVSVGAAVTVSNLTSRALASIEQSSATATGGFIQVLADSELDITAAAAGLDVAGDFTLGGSVVYNNVSGATQAWINRSTTDSVGLAVSATDQSTINSGAGNASIGVDDYGAMGAGIAVNRINNDVLAEVNESAVNSSGRIDITADSSPTIVAVALGISGSVSDRRFSASLVGSGAGNRISSRTLALVDGGSVVTTTAGGGNGSSVNLTAADNATIRAGAGALSFDVSLFKGGMSVAVGASAAMNEIGKSDFDEMAIVAAAISDSTITAAGDVNVIASGTPTIHADTVSGAADVSVEVDKPTNVGIAGAGAGVSNQIYLQVQSQIDSGACVSSTMGGPCDANNGNGQSSVPGGGDVNLIATNGAVIKSGAGGLAIPVVIGGNGVAIAFGAALVLNDIGVATSANIVGATVVSVGQTQLTATDDSKIATAAVGVGGSVAIGAKDAVALGGAGSGVGNHIVNSITAQITDSDHHGGAARSNVTSGGDVVLRAIDHSSVIAAAGTLAFGVARSLVGDDALSVAPAIGVAVAINEINNSVTANISASTVASGRDVTLTANASPPDGGYSVKTVTVAGGVAVGGSPTLSVTFAGAGAGSGNTINRSVVASISSGSSVTAAGDISLSAEDQSSVLSDGGGITVSVAVGATAIAPAIGAGESSNSVSNITQATIDHSTVAASGRVTLDATSQPDIQATAFGVAVSVAWGEAGVASAGSGAAAYNDISNATIAAIQNGSTVTADGNGDDAIVVSASDDPTLTATSGSGSLGFSYGAAASVALAVGVSLARNTVTKKEDNSDPDGTYPTAAASIGALSGADATTVTALRGGVQVTANSSQTATAKSTEVAATIAIPSDPETTISIALTGSGASSTNDFSNAITTAIGSGATVQAANGSVAILAREIPNLDAEATGVAVSVGAFSVAIDGTVAHSTLNAAVQSYVGDDASIVANDLTVQAEQQQVGAGAPTVSASATAGSGAVTAGVDAAKSEATVGGSVKAYTGSNVTLPDGDITIAATSSTLQSAESTGVSAGIDLAVGANDSTAMSDVQVSATLGAASVMNAARTGSLVIEATGSDQNAAWSIAGAGGAVAGDGASAKTDNSSTVAAAINGGAIYAGNVAVLASHNSRYATGVNSINASIAGASGAEAHNTDATAATVRIGSGTSIIAAGLVTIAAQNQIAQSANPNASDINKGASAYAGAGGVITGDAAGNNATIGGLDDMGNPMTTVGVSMGDSVRISSGTDPFTNPGGIVIAATSGFQANDRVLLSTGGVIAGGGTGSTINAILDNAISIGADSSLSSWGNVGVGTASSINASTVSQSNVGGLGGTSDAHATSNVTSNQTVTVGNRTTIFGFGNVQLTAGTDPLGAESLITSSSNASAYAYGAVTVPVATATTTLTSNAHLFIDCDAQVLSGQDTKLGAYAGDLSPMESWNQYWNSANTQSGPGTQPTATTSATVAIEGTVTAGVYHSLTIDIPADQANPPRISMQSSGPEEFLYPNSADLGRPRTFAASFTSPTYNPQPGYYADFNPTAFIRTYFDPVTASMLFSGVASGTVPAYVLPNLFASGGEVTIDGTLNGAGTVTAHGAPSITVNNESAAYLMVNDVLIPDIAAGQVLVNGSPMSGNMGGVALAPTASGANASVTIDVSFQAANGTPGPGLFLMGTISNQGGAVALKDATGSLGQTGEISAGSVSVTVPNGVYGTYIPTGVYSPNTYGDPASQWQDQMIWPGGKYFQSGAPQPNSIAGANNAINYVANYVENAAQYENSYSYMQALIGYFTTKTINSSKDTPPDLNLFDSIFGRASRIYVGDSIPFLTEFNGGHDGFNDNFGAFGNTAGVNQGAYKIYTASNPNNHNNPFYGDQYYYPNTSSDRGYTPILDHAIKLTQTIAQYPLRTAAAATKAKSLSVTAEFIDMNGLVEVGRSSDKSVNISGANLQHTLQSFQDVFAENGSGASTIDISSYLSTTQVNDDPIAATYDARTRQIILDNVSSVDDGKVYLNGKIVNTYASTTNGSGSFNLRFLGGLGRIEVSNQLAPITIDGQPYQIPIVIQNVKAAAVAGSLTVIDHNYSPAQQTLLLYEPLDASGPAIKEFTGTADELLGSGTPARTIRGNSAIYQPKEDSAWRWAETATLSRSQVGTLNTSSFGLNPWHFDFPDGSPNNPWQAAMPSGCDSMSGCVVFDSSLSASSSSNSVFKQSVSGAVTNELFDDVFYSKFTIVSDPGFSWTYRFPLAASLTLTNTVRADNPIGIQFSGKSQGSLAIDSTSEVILAGDIDLPNSSIVIHSQGGIKQSANHTLVGESIVLNASAQSVGNPAVPQSQTNASIGQVAINGETFSGDSLPVSMSFYSTVAGGHLTPLVFAVNGGEYELAAIYESVPTVFGVNDNVPLSLLQGQLNPSGTYAFGFSDQKVTLNGTTLTTESSTPGSVPFAQSITGFGGSGAGWTVNSNGISYTPITSDVLTLTDNNTWQARSAWFNSPVPTSSFTASFVYQASGDKCCDGVALVFQNQGLAALGANGGALGYAGISGKTAAYEINIWNGHTQGANFVESQQVQVYNATGSVNVASGNPIAISLVYDAAAGTLIETLTDLITNATFSRIYSNIDLESTLGSATALVGFTGATGGGASYQTISDFQFHAGSVPSSSVEWLDTQPVGSSPVGLALGNRFAVGPGAERLLAATGRTYSANVLLLRSSGGGIGSRSTPLNISLGKNGALNAQSGGDGDVYLKVNTGATIGLIAAGGSQYGYGDVMVDAVGNLEPLGNGSWPNVIGKNISLTSRQGFVGTSGGPLVIETHGALLANRGVRDGVVTVQALDDIGLSVARGDLVIGSVTSANGDVYLSVPSGSVYDAATRLSADATLAEAETEWANLGLTDPTFGLVGVAAFENGVVANYHQLWQLLENGAVTDGQFTLNDSSISVFAPQAAAALGVSDPTADQVQSYAVGRYNGLVAFFDENLSSDWMSQPAFQAFDPSFAYTATPQQVVNLTLHTRWTRDQLTYAVKQSALQSAANDPLQDQTPHVAGKSVTIVAGGEVGMVRAAKVISLSAIQNSTLTDDEKAALALAHVAGEALYVGTDSHGNTVTFADGQAPEGVTVSGVQLTIHRPLVTAITSSANAALNVSAPSGIAVSQTAGDLTVGTIQSNGAVELNATGSIREGSQPAVGDEPIARFNWDDSIGQVHINRQAVSGAALPTSFSYYATSLTDYSVTPLLFAVNNGSYSLAAIYQSLSPTHAGVNSAPLIISQGSPSESGDYVFGFIDSEPARNGAGNLGVFSASADVGSPGLDGSAVYDSVSQSYTVVGSGADIWNTSDQFRYVYDSVHGDASIAAQVVSMQHTDDWAKAGVMFRDGTATDAAYAILALTPTNGLAFQWRSSAGASAEYFGYVAGTAPAWVKLLRSGDTFTAYSSMDGATWTQVGTPQSIPMSAPTAGLAVTSHNNNDLSAATFTKVKLSGGAIPFDSDPVGDWLVTTGLPTNGASLALNQVFSPGRGGASLQALGRDYSAQVISATTVIDGFGVDGTGWTVNSNGNITSTPITNDVLTLTDNQLNSAARSAWFNTPVDLNSFTASFTYQAGGNKAGDGVALVFQNQGLNALGASGGALGYAGIDGQTAAYEINIYNGHTQGTQFATNGVTGAYNATSPVSVESGNAINVVLTYDAVAHTLLETLTDQSNKTFYSHRYANIDLATILGSSSALIGFTGADGGSISTQSISNFTWTVPRQGTVSGATINLTALGGSIGQSDLPLSINVGSGLFNASAQTGVSVVQSAGNLNVGAVQTSQGDIFLDPPTPDQSVILGGDSVVSAPHGRVTLQAHNDVLLAAGSVVHGLSVTVQGGFSPFSSASPDSRITLAGLLDAASILVLGGSGNDIVWLGSDGAASGSLDRIRGSIEFRGGGGADQLNLDDRAAEDAVGRPLRTGYAVTPNQIGDNPGWGATARDFEGLVFDASVSRLQLYGSAGSAVFHVKPSMSTEYQLVGHPDANTGLLTGNSLILDGTATVGGVREQLLRDGQPVVGAGTWSFAQPHRSFEFSGMQNFHNVTMGATASAPIVDRATTDDATFSVTFEGFTALDIGGGLGEHDAVRVVGPNGYSQLARFVSVAPSWDGRSQIATYRVPAPGGGWDRTDNGAYPIEVLPGQVADGLGRVLEVSQIGTLSVNVDALWLTSTLLAPGQYRLDLTGASPGANVVFVRGSHAGQYPLSPLGPTLDVVDPLIVAERIADSTGRVQLVAHIPAEATNSWLGFQAFAQAPQPLTSQLVSAAPSPRLITSIESVGGKVISGSTLQFTVMFVRPVLGVTLDEFALVTHHKVAGAFIKDLTGHGGVYTVTVDTGVGDGTLELALKDETAISAATGVPFDVTRQGLFTGPTVTIHKTREDVDLDFFITPLDALIVINSLNAHAGSFVPDGSAVDPPWRDVNGDGWVTPLDALIILNYLNFQSPSEGEGENGPIVDPSIVALQSAAPAFTLPPNAVVVPEQTPPTWRQCVATTPGHVELVTSPSHKEQAVTHDDWEDVLEVIAADPGRRETRSYAESPQFRHQAGSPRRSAD